MGFRVWGLGFGVRGSGFGVWGWGFGVWGLGWFQETLYTTPSTEPETLLRRMGVQHRTLNATVP